MRACAYCLHQGVRVEVQRGSTLVRLLLLLSRQQSYKKMKRSTKVGFCMRHMRNDSPVAAKPPIFTDVGTSVKLCITELSSFLLRGPRTPPPSASRCLSLSQYAGHQAPMAAAASTPGMLWLHQKKSERQRDPTPGQEPWHNLRQPKASKRAAVDANAVGGAQAARRAAPASATPATPPVTGCPRDGSTLFFSALRVVMAGRGGERWLGTVLELSVSCFEACNDCRKLVPLRLRVLKQTPEHLWKRGATAWEAGGASSTTNCCGGGGGSGGGGGGGGSRSGSEGDVRSEFSDDDLGRDNSSGSNAGGEFRSASGNGGGGGRDQPFGWGCQRPPRRERSGLGYSLSSHRALPAPRIAGMLWERPTLAEVSFGSDLAEITFGPAVIEPLHGVAWTSGLKRLTLSSNWNLPAAPRGGGDGIEAGENWPPLLQELFFGEGFSQPVDGVAFPPSLRSLSFGEAFNHGVDLVAWPPALQHLAFGRPFNQSVERVSWPASLQRLSFGVSFDRPVSGVAWPASLRHLSFGYRFNRPVAGVVWPAALQTLSFGHDFNQPLVGVAWPASLKRLSFGFEFDQPVAGVALPASLQQLSFGYCFDQPIAGAAWPASLQQLTFGGLFNHPIVGVVWPASLRHLTLGYGFMQSADEGTWPIGLSHLSVDRDYPLSRSSLPNGVRVELT